MNVKRTRATGIDEEGALPVIRLSPGGGRVSHSTHLFSLSDAGRRVKAMVTVRGSLAL
jgi:hypothetical protein